MTIASRARAVLLLFTSVTALSASAGAAAQAPRSPSTSVTGIVVDAAGAPVAGASVTLDAAGVPRQTQSGDDGRFTFADVSGGPVTVRASAPGFSEAAVQVRVGAAADAVLVLRPAPLAESVTVTASRGAVRLETAASTTVLTSAVLLNSATGTVDDALRNTPGFSLFRRASSRTANPTTQGVTMRGVSGSGASRTLVLADGLPLNDAFGSWVYWNRVPQAAIDRVEVVRGATGDLYGADALGGVIQVLTFAPDRPRLRAIVDGGSHDTARVSMFGGARARGWVGSVAGEWVRTDGVPVIAKGEGGPADRPADSDYRNAYATGGYDAGTWRATLRGSVYAEDRGNGTLLQVNSTAWRQVGGQASGAAPWGAWLAHAAGGTQSYYQTFTAASADRRTDRLTTAQRIPTSFATFGGQWVRPIGSHAVLAGAEGKWTKGTEYETRYSLTGVPSGPFVFGGTERSGSAYGRVSIAARPDVTVVAGARGDVWKSDPRDPALAAHSVSFFSPRAAVSWRAGSQLSFHGSAYRAYRTPTLNELHRGFRVGNTVTNPNPLLAPEKLTGVEGSALVARARASARVTTFWNVLNEAITNVTLTVTPALTTRERQNTDRVRAAGLEIEADVRPHARLTLGALAAFTASRFSETPAQPALKGHRVPQVPTYQLGLSATVTAPQALTLSTQVRVVGAQFEDDQNELELDRYAVVDAYAGRALSRGVHAFVAVENLFDTQYLTGLSRGAARAERPDGLIRSVGWPRTVRGGIRVFLP